MKKNKKFTFKQGVVAAVVCTLSVVAVTMAVLKADVGSKTNKFSSNGKVNVAVIENGNKDKLYETGDGLELPEISSTPVLKQIQVMNVDKVDYPTTNTYVRVRLVPSFVYNEGENHAGETVAVNMDANDSKYTFAPLDNWAAKEIAGETYYFYKKALAPNAISEMLIESVAYTGTIPEGAHFELRVLIDGVSANGSGTKYSSAVKAWELESYLSDEEIASLLTNEIQKN